ncbi:MAG: deoxyribodipyrimidine photo-lyase, partial [Phyllobacterium sp.]
MSIDIGKPVIVLFRHDLRIADNRAFYAASRSEKPVIPVFLWDEETSSDIRPIGGARRWWLHHSLAALAASLRGPGATLVLRRGKTKAIVNALIEETGADMVLWNRRYDPPGFGIDGRLRQELARQGVGAEDFEGQLLHEPSVLKTSTGGYYRVYTPFWRAINAGPEPRDPIPAPEKIKVWHREIPSQKLEDWALLPKKPDWAGHFSKVWTPGEHGAHERLEAFLDDAVGQYPSDRDRPS